MKSLLAALLFLGLLASCSPKADQGDGEAAAAEGSEKTAELPMGSLEMIWATDTVLRTPESVLYYPEENVLFVANINGVNLKNPDGDGFISKLSPEGEVLELKWATGLNDPKGMGIYNGMLFVADINEVALIDLASGALVKSYKDETAQFLNDITVDTTSRSVYVTDMNTSRLYLIKDDMLIKTMEDSTVLQKPNGLYMDDGDQLMMLSMGGGKLMAVTTGTFEVEDLSEGFPGADGIAKTEKGNYVISNWNGEVYLYSPSGEKLKLLDTKSDEINAADIDYAVGKKMLYVPTFYDNRVVAYELTEN